MHVSELDSAQWSLGQYIGAGGSCMSSTVSEGPYQITYVPIGAGLVMRGSWDPTGDAHVLPSVSPPPLPSCMLQSCQGKRAVRAILYHCDPMTGRNNVNEDLFCLTVSEFSVHRLWLHLF